METSRRQFVCELLSQRHKAMLIVAPGEAVWDFMATRETLGAF